MPSPIATGVGVVAIVLGIAWVAWPAKMQQLQVKYLYFGVTGDDDEEQTDTQELIGRVTGGILALLGAALVANVLP